MLKKTLVIWAVCASVAATPAAAATYTASFSGPTLGPDFTINEDPGTTSTASLGTAVLSKLANTQTYGPYENFHSSYTSKVLAEGDFVASLTLNSAALGKTSFYFQATRPGAIGQVALTDGQLTNAIVFGIEDPRYVSAYTTDKNFTFELRRTGNSLTVDVLGFQQVTYDYGVDASTIEFGLVGRYNDLPDYVSGFVSNFTITSPGAPPICGVAAPCTGGVPEPANWALLIAGFGLTGAAMRRRRLAVAA